MLDVKAVLGKITDWISHNEYVTEQKTIYFSFSNQRYKEVIGSVAKTGYTPIGIVGWNFSTVDWFLSKCYISGDNANLYIFRTGNATASVNVVLTVLYKRA